MTYIYVVNLFLFLNFIHPPVLYICWRNTLAMTTKELQNSIIEKVLNSRDELFLDYLNQLLDEENGAEVYKLSDFEKTIISDGTADYATGNVISNEDVILRNQEWLEE